MLKFLRKRKIAKRIFWLLAIIIVPAFIFWGSATVISDRRSKNYAGIIFGKKVSYDQYRQAWEAWRNQLKMKFGDNAYQIEKVLDYNQAIWDKLILLYEANRRRIKVDNEEVSQLIMSLPFLKKDNVFDQSLYELFLRYSLNSPPRVFEEEIRENLKVEKLFNQVTDDVKITDEEVKDKYREQHQQIKLNYVSVLPKDLAKEVKLTEQELKDYYEKQKDDFKISIQINLNYAGFDYPKGATEEQKQEIDKKAAELNEFLKQGNDLIKAKDKFNLQIKETGFFSLGEQIPNFGWRPKEFTDLFNLKENQITDIFNTPRGPYVFQLKEKRLDYLPNFQDVKEKIKDEVTAQKSKELAKAKMDDYYSQIKQIKEKNPDFGLKKIAAQISLPIKETEFFNMNAPVSQIGFSKEFNDVAFKLADAEISQVIEIPTGYFVVEVSERKPIDEKELEKEKESLKKSLLEEKKNQVFQEFFEGLRKKANLRDYISEQQKQQSAKSN